MTWNYRIIRVAENESSDYFCHIIEAHYSDSDRKVPSSWTDGPSVPIGSDRADLLLDLQMMIKAFDLPALEERNGKLVEVSE